MSGLIKAGEDFGSLGIRAVAAPAPVREDRLGELARQIDALKEEIRGKTADLARAMDAQEAARAKGFEAGYAAGLAAAEDGLSARLARLDTGIAQAQEQLGTSLAAIEPLAALLARECLDTMFGTVEDRAARVTALLRHQMRQIEASAVLSVAVSAEDFAEPALVALGGRFDPGAIAVRIEDDLPSGACRIGLKLGQIDAGLDEQWGALRTLLGDCAADEANA